MKARERLTAELALEAKVRFLGGGQTFPSREDSDKEIAMKVTWQARQAIVRRLKIAREEVTKVMTIGYSQSAGEVIEQATKLISQIDKLMREVKE